MSAITQDTDAGRPLPPLAVGAGEGEARWWLGALAVIKATAAGTDGRLTVVEMTHGPGSAAPLHVHHREDEAFWILEGDVAFEVGGATIAAHAGDFVFGPRDLPHRYTVGAAGCRLLYLLTPSGLEGLIREMSQPAGRRTLPPPPAGAPDRERMAAVAAAHGCELLA